MNKKTRLIGLASVVMGALALLTPNSPAAQDSAQGAPGPAIVEQREALANELARIDAAFRVDGDAAAARRDLEALLEAPGAASLVEGDPAMRSARDALRRRLDAAAAPSDVSVEEAVLDAVRRWDLPTLEQLGERGVSVVSQKLVAAMAAPESGPRRDDPYRLLQVLLLLAPQQGAVLGQQELTAGRLNGATVIRLLDDPLAEAWSNVPGGRPELMVSELLDLFLLSLARAKASELDWDEVVDVEKVLADRDAFVPEFVERFTTHVLQSGRREAVKALGALDEDVQWPSVQPFYERQLKHPDEHVRVDAAERLSHYRDSAALRAAVADPSRDVRRLLATMLRRKDVKQPSWPSRNGQCQPVVESVFPNDDAELRSILVRLSQDEDPQVREAAVTSIGRLSPPVNRDVLERLAQDPDPGVRAVLMSILDPEDSADAALLKVLVSSGDPILVSSSRLHPLLWEAAGDPLKADEILSILRAIPPSTARSELLRGIGSKVAVSSTAGRNGLTRWTLETGEPMPLDVALAPIGANPGPTYSESLLEGWSRLHADEIARLYPIVAIEAPTTFAGLWRRLVYTQAPPGLARALRPVFHDASQPVIVRLGALVAAAAEPDAALEAELLDFIDGPAIGEATTEAAVGLLQAFGFALPESDPNRILLAVLQRAGLPGVLLPFALEHYSPYGPDGEALTEAILRRWGPSCTSNEWEPLQKAIEHAGTLRGRLDPQLLIAATRNPLVADYAGEAMCRQRDPVFLPTLAECIEAPWLPRDPREVVSETAVASVTAYMSDDAVRILLQAAAETSDSGLRQQCLKGVDTIRRFQDALADWERRDAGRATRDDAVGTLAGMLDDPSPQVRAEALRALVSLRAVEYLPQIIQGLKDVDAAVREAARQALEQHHRLEAEGAAAEPDRPPTGDASDDATPEGAPPQADDGD